MTKSYLSKISVGLMGVAIVLIAGVAVVAVSALTTPVWPPDDATREKVIKAFDAVLTHAAVKPTDGFRAQITGVEVVAAAKTAVQQEVDKQNPPAGTITIPADIVIMFYEPDPAGEAAGVKQSKSAMSTSAEKSLEAAWKAMSDSNHQYHVFALPAIDGKPHFYKDQLRCCYPAWRPTPAPGGR